MSRPTAGNYFIYSRTLSADGKELAITYNGNNTSPTLTELTRGDAQIWMVADYNAETQSISPIEDTGLQIAHSGTTITVLDGAGYVFTIRTGETALDGYTIQDGSRNNTWGVDENVDVGSKVFLSDSDTSTDNDLFRWVFEQV